jgi:hypothetical protein
MAFRVRLSYLPVPDPVPQPKAPQKRGIWPLLVATLLFFAGYAGSKYGAERLSRAFWSQNLRAGGEMLDSACTTNEDLSFVTTSCSCDTSLPVLQGEASEPCVVLACGRVPFLWKRCLADRNMTQDQEFWAVLVCPQARTRWHTSPCTLATAT